MANCYLAQEASRKSGKYVVEGNKQAWLDLFADDAIGRQLQDIHQKGAPRGRGSTER